MTSLLNVWYHNLAGGGALTQMLRRYGFGAARVLSETPGVG
jgi:hypothetical protein